MKKSSILIIAILVLSAVSLSFVFAEESNTAGRMMKEDVRMIKEISERPHKPMIYKMHLMGKGIAVNPSDLNDFSRVSIVAAKVAVPNGSIIGKGILQIEREKYWLSNIIVEGNSGSADVYAKESRTKIGDLSLTKKEGTDAIWHGVLNLNSRNMHIYLLGMSRGFSGEEQADKAKDYCKDNPEDLRCKSVSGYDCKSNPEQCREKITRYCTDHPTDARCKELLRAYCREHPDDERCKAPETSTTTETTATSSIETTSTIATTTVEGSSTSTTSILVTTTVGA